MSKDDEVQNRRIHVIALAFTKTGDGLVDPKIILAWLMTYVGASAGLIGLLVPVREAGALLPQLFTAAKLRNFPIRKWWWVIGSLVQSIAVLMIALSGLFLTGQVAGIAIVGGVAVFALARSISSVSYKDVLGKTVGKNSRGVTTGTAASIAAFGILLFGFLLLFEVIDRLQLVLGALFMAALFWLLAGIVFSRLNEEPSQRTDSTLQSIWKTYIHYLISDRELQKFLLVRALLTATAVAPPFLLLLAGDTGSGVLSQLGALVIASSFATFVSGRIWGQLADYSTAVVLAGCGLLGGAFLSLGLVGAAIGWFETVWFLPLLIFVFMVSYQGVRIARTIHLVNLANEDTRAAYTAISNTIIGIVLLATGLYGLLAEVTSVSVVLGVLSVMSLLGGLLAFRLRLPREL